MRRQAGRPRRSALCGVALAQRLADDLSPAFRAELGEDVRDMGLYGTPGQEQAPGDIRRRVAPGDHGSDLHLGWRERLPAEGSTLRTRTADAASDAVGPKPAFGPPYVPAGLQALVEADCLVQGGPRLILLAVLGQYHSQVLECGRQLRGRAGLSVVLDSLA